MGNFGPSRMHSQCEAKQERTHNREGNKEEADGERGSTWSPQRCLKVGTYSGQGNDNPRENSDQAGGHIARHIDHQDTERSEPTRSLRNTQGPIQPSHKVDHLYCPP